MRPYLGRVSSPLLVGHGRIDVRCPFVPPRLDVFVVSFPVVCLVVLVFLVVVRSRFPVRRVPSFVM